MYRTLLPALALLAAPAASAQSLHDTHQRIWAPSGKVPALSYHPRGRATCGKTAMHHQAGKTPLATPRCATAAKAKPAAAVAAR